MVIPALQLNAMATSFTRTTIGTTTLRASVYWSARGGRSGVALRRPGPCARMRSSQSSSSGWVCWVSSRSVLSTRPRASWKSALGNPLPPPRRQRMQAMCSCSLIELLSPQVQQASDTGNELPRFNRLGQVHLVAGQQGPLPVFGPRVCGNSDSGNRPWPAAIELTHTEHELIAVQVGHADVTDENVEAMLLHQVQCYRACGDRCHRGAAPFEDTHHQLPPVGLIVNDQYGLLVQSWQLNSF